MNQLYLPSKLRRVALLTIACLGGITDHVRAAQPWDWLKGSPDGINVSSRRLDALRDELRAKKTSAFLVIRNDRVIYEWYAPGAAAGDAVVSLRLEGLLSEAQLALVAGAGWSPANKRFTLRAAARIGRLLQNKGDWNGTRILGGDKVDRLIGGGESTGWDNNARRRYPKLNDDAFWTAGDGGEILLVVPGDRLIAVRAGAPIGTNADRADAIRRTFLEPVAQAVILSSRPVAATPPYPRSPVIQGVIWAPKSEIIRRAPGGDNWPSTWADDDALYTAYGDGNGFEPFVPQKLSIGLSKVTGFPPDFRGENLRSPTMEATGADVSAHKASGMLMVDGVLYILVRNVGNSRLASSHDHGVTWTWADWKFTTSFGCPTILNYGRNYAGARDSFVYIYSADRDSAYESADRMVMARVAKDQILRRDAYEFFAGIDAGGQPRWTKDIARREAVFTSEGRCYRSGITYNAALKRYLWCQILPASKHPNGPRFQGGFGIYDAPEPWGPWTTVFYAPEWDVGPGESNSLPTKWMSADGRTVHLLFSGEDSFSVRQAKLTLTTK